MVPGELSHLVRQTVPDQQHGGGAERLADVHAADQGGYVAAPCRVGWPPQPVLPGAAAVVTHTGVLRMRACQA